MDTGHTLVYSDKSFSRDASAVTSLPLSNSPHPTTSKTQQGKQPENANLAQFVPKRCLSSQSSPLIFWPRRVLAKMVVSNMQSPGQQHRRHLGAC